MIEFSVWSCNVFLLLHCPNTFFLFSLISLNTLMLGDLRHDLIHMTGDAESLPDGTLIGLTCSA